MKRAPVVLHPGPAPRRRGAAAGLALLLALPVLTLPACRAERELGADVPRQRPQAGMVVCEHPLAAEVGARVLRRGGNAVDAGFAAALALAVVYPQAGNLGGGGFALWVPGDGPPAALDFRETAPGEAEPGLYRDAEGEPDPDLLREGALSVAVPGSPAGLWELLERYGSGLFTAQELAQPAVALARDGFEVDAVLARDLAREATRERLIRHRGARELFYPSGAALREGQLLLQPELAGTLAAYAREGPGAIYTGSVASAILSELAAEAAEQGLSDLRGTIRAWDLAGYRTRPREPLRGWFRGREVITMPPPSSGGIVLLQVLSVLSGFPLDAQRGRRLAELAAEGAQPGAADAGGLDVRVLHWWTEALRWSFGLRATSHGDPDFYAVPLEDLLSPDRIARCRMEIGEQVESKVVGEVEREGDSTTHLSVVDVQGNALALTTTLNSSFGSGILVRGAGFLLNNEMDDFALGSSVANQFGLVGGEANCVQGGKRPLSSMTPVVLRDGGHTVSLVAGSPGGPRIITAVIGVLLRTLVYEQSLSEAVAAPRFHQQWSPPWTEFEPGWPEELLEGLRRRGHDARAVAERWASVQAIRIAPDGRIEGASDPRRGGAAVAAPPR